MKNKISWKILLLFGIISLILNQMNHIFGLLAAILIVLGLVDLFRELFKKDERKTN
jgi:hypothetical protein